MADITMPQLGETVTEGTITKWFKSVGDEISEDERKRSIEELDKITHSETKKIEDLSAAKEKEIVELK